MGRDDDDTVVVGDDDVARVHHDAAESDGFTDRARSVLEGSGGCQPAREDGHAELLDDRATTAYRHFSSVEEILHAFRAQVGSELRDFSARQTTRGMVRLEAVSRCWVSLVLEHGGAMAQMRSHRGYLERLREGTGYLAPQAEALAEPLRQTTEELGLGDLGDEALFLWNLLFDPRDILDLIKSGHTEDEAATRLVAALRGALIGWSAAADGNH